MSEKQARETAIEYISWYGTLLEVARDGRFWRARYCREDTMGEWKHIGVADWYADG